jgi:phosphomethylpyrimidine synthase
MNQLTAANQGIVTEEMQEVSRLEGMPAETLIERIRAGQLIILRGRFNKKQVVGIGKGLRTKINASIGTSSACCNLDVEVEKAKTAELHMQIR